MSDITKEIDEIFKIVEDVASEIGIRVLMAYKCIYCGHVFDDLKDMKFHGNLCKNKGNLDDN